jgi:hypothetical protein
MKNKIGIGLIVGLIAGILDVIPMIIQDLTWDANLGAFSMWIIVGFFVSTSNLSIKPVLKGLLYAYLTLIPSAFLIAWNEPFALVPIFIMTTILGALLGFFIDRYIKKYSS